jgi:hypothetical protein
MRQTVAGNIRLLGDRELRHFTIFARTWLHGKDCATPFAWRAECSPSVSSTVVLASIRRPIPVARFRLDSGTRSFAS